MSGYISLWVTFGLQSWFLLAAGAFECLQKETLIRQTPRRVTPPTDCLMECTSMTYFRKVQLQDKHTIRLGYSTEGDLGEYCWSTDLKCTVGDSFLHAYVVLPVDTSAVGHEQLEVRSTTPTVTALQAHQSPTTLAESCGLRYDVTRHFGTPNSGTSFCMQVSTEGDPLGDRVLRCAPFLVTFWQRNLDQSNHHGAG
ncbi:gonadal somatic cell derived factor [Pholidichthys leucotaenia]